MITNRAAGMQASLSHDETMVLLKGVDRLTTLIAGLLASLDEEARNA